MGDATSEATVYIRGQKSSARALGQTRGAAPLYSSPAPEIGYCHDTLHELQAVSALQKLGKWAEPSCSGASEIKCQLPLAGRVPPHGASRHSALAYVRHTRATEHLARLQRALTRASRRHNGERHGMYPVMDCWAGLAAGRPCRLRALQ